MGLHPHVDEKSGFCYGVIRAIKQAETFLKTSPNLNSLGSIVHNTAEVSRLRNLGINVIDHDKLKQIKDSTILIRAHGEPPSTYLTAKENRIKIIDCTCPVVLKLQERIKKGYEEVKKKEGSLVIFGKKCHAEVNGLLGHFNGDALVVETKEDLAGLDFQKPIVIFSQTTKDTVGYANIIAEIKQRVAGAGGSPDNVVSHNTICRQVSSRHPNLKQFAAKNDVLLFVSGKESSNGKVLYGTCKSSNPRSYKIESISDIDPSWFNPGETVGICGATSTPIWQLEEVAMFIKGL